MSKNYTVKHVGDKITIFIRLHHVWFNFMNSMAHTMWDDFTSNALPLIEDVQHIILAGSQKVNPIKINKMFRDGMTSMFLGDAFIEFTNLPNPDDYRFEVQIMDGNDTIIIPHINVVF